MFTTIDYILWLLILMSQEVHFTAADSIGCGTVRGTPIDYQNVTAVNLTQGYLAGQVPPNPTFSNNDFQINPGDNQVYGFGDYTIDRFTWELDFTLLFHIYQTYNINNQGDYYGLYFGTKTPMRLQNGPVGGFSFGIGLTTTSEDRGRTFYLGTPSGNVYAYENFTEALNGPVLDFSVTIRYTAATSEMVMVLEAYEQEIKEETYLVTYADKLPTYNSLEPAHFGLLDTSGSYKNNIELINYVFQVRNLTNPRRNNMLVPYCYYFRNVIMDETEYVDNFTPEYQSDDFNVLNVISSGGIEDLNDFDHSVKGFGRFYESISGTMAYIGINEGDMGLIEGPVDLYSNQIISFTIHMSSGVLAFRNVNVTYYDASTLDVIWSVQVGLKNFNVNDGYKVDYDTGTFGTHKIDFTISNTFINETHCDVLFAGNTLSYLLQNVEYGSNQKGKLSFYFNSNYAIYMENWSIVVYDVLETTSIVTETINKTALAYASSTTRVTTTVTVPGTITVPTVVTTSTTKTEVFRITRSESTEVDTTDSTVISSVEIFSTVYTVTDTTVTTETPVIHPTSIIDPTTTVTTTTKSSLTTSSTKSSLTTSSTKSSLTTSSTKSSITTSSTSSSITTSSITPTSPITTQSSTTWISTSSTSPIITTPSSSSLTSTSWTSVSTPSSRNSYNMSSTTIMTSTSTTPYVPPTASSTPSNDTNGTVIGAAVGGSLGALILIGAGAYVASRYIGAGDIGSAKMAENLNFEGENPLYTPEQGFVDNQLYTMAMDKDYQYADEY